MNKKIFYIFLLELKVDAKRNLTLKFTDFLLDLEIIFKFPSHSDPQLGERKLNWSCRHWSILLLPALLNFMFGFVAVAFFFTAVKTDPGIREWLLFRDFSCTFRLNTFIFLWRQNNNNNNNNSSGLQSGPGSTGGVGGCFCFSPLQQQTPPLTIEFGPVQVCCLSS